MPPAGPARAGLPFRPFFLLAPIDAILGVGLWLPALAGRADDLGGMAATWHARELLFSAYPAILSGFLLTALPRWTGRPLADPRLGTLLAALWIIGPVSLVLLPVARGPIAAAYVTIRAGVVTHQILRTGDRRNLVIVPLLILLAGAGMVALLPGSGASEISFRLALAALLGLVMVVGGRVIPSLTAVQLERCGRSGPPPVSKPLDVAAAVAAAVALGAWILAAESRWAGYLCAAAAVGQAARCLRWQPWRAAASPAVFPLHLAYACIPLGFAMALGHALDPAVISRSVALHVWAIGAIGLMCVTLMASMIRRQLGFPLTRSALLDLAIVLLLAALAARTAAELLDAARHPLLLAAAAAWVAGHLLFLARFARALLLGRR